MKPILFGVLAVFVLFLGVAIYMIRANTQGEIPIGLAAVLMYSTQLPFLVIYGVGFGVAYWLTRW